MTHETNFILIAEQLADIIQFIEAILKELKAYRSRPPMPSTSLGCVWQKKDTAILTFNPQQMNGIQLEHFTSPSRLSFMTNGRWKML
jgi:hypothetical protein